MKTIVSVTPLRVQEDSRTFKIAASFARFGYESTVVEGQPSDLNREELPFKLISIGGAITSNTKPLASDQDKLVGQKRTMKGRNASMPRAIYDRIKRVMRPIYYRRTESSSQGFWIGWVGFLMFVVNFTIANCLVPLRHIPRASLYYLHAPSYFPAVYLLCKRYRVPFIYDAHDFYAGMRERDDITPFERRWICPFLFRLESTCIKNAASIVTVCDGVARLQEETFERQPIVVRNCHDHRLDRPPLIGLRQLLGLSQAALLIVTIGTAKPGRAIEQSFDAMRRLPDNVHLAFVGKDTAQFANVIRQYGLADRVHLLPPVLPREVVPFIESGDASIILYYARSREYEYALPNSFFQSIAARLPLLYPELPEIDRIARQYGLGIPIDPLDPESIRTGIMRLMSNRDLSQELRSNLSVAREELSWEREEAILRDLLVRNTQRASRH